MHTIMQTRTGQECQLPYMSNLRRTKKKKNTCIKTWMRYWRYKTREENCKRSIRIINLWNKKIFLTQYARFWSETFFKTWTDSLYCRDQVRKCLASIFFFTNFRIKEICHFSEFGCCWCQSVWIKYTEWCEEQTTSGGQHLLTRDLRGQQQE